LRELGDRVKADPRVEVLTGYEVVKSSGFVGNFKTTVVSVDDPTQRLIEHGVTIVATGGREYRGNAYLLGQDSKVISQDDLGQLLAKADQLEGAEAEQAAMTLDACRTMVMIQCVGPWDDGSDDAPDFYCSRVCCTVALKNAMAIKKRNPRANVYILYKDMRTYGFKEALYTQARDEGVIFLRYDDVNKPQVQRNNGQLQVTINDLVLQTPIVLKPDLLVLSEAMVPAEGSKELAELLKFSCTLEGFFLEAHVKLRPVDFPAEGIFLCGAAHYPKFIDETIAQANAAAARATTILSKDMLQVGGVVAVVDEEKCTGCLTCVRICPYDVPRMNLIKVGAGGILGAAEIAAAACQGCGSCAAECPAKAIELQHYRDEQMIAKEEALFEALLVA
jgi:heterodisulfide reductase subunit A